MPLYTYQCQTCRNEDEHVVSYEERDTPFVCSKCGSPTERAGVEQFALGKEPYQPGAVLSSGAKVKGHFGKEAPLRKKR